MSDIPQEDPLEYIDMDDVLKHGDPGRWTFCGPKSGSPVPAKSPNAPPGTLKHYDVYKDDYGDPIEVHYFRYPDGSVGNVKVEPPS